MQVGYVLMVKDVSKRSKEVKDGTESSIIGTNKPKMTRVQICTPLSKAILNGFR